MEVYENLYSQCFCALMVATCCVYICLYLYSVFAKPFCKGVRVGYDVLYNSFISGKLFRMAGILLLLSSFINLHQFQRTDIFLADLCRKVLQFLQFFLKFSSFNHRILISRYLLTIFFARSTCVLMFLNIYGLLHATHNYPFLSHLCAETMSVFLYSHLCLFLRFP